jgi:hypothetical protein
VLGVIYSRAQTRADELQIHTLDDLERLPSVVKNLQFFAQPKYRLAADRPGSGNTKNIGSVNTISALTNGQGPFAALGERGRFRRLLDVLSDRRHGPRGGPSQIAVYEFGRLFCL